MSSFFVIRDHYRLLISALDQDCGQKKAPDFVFNLFCADRKTVYKIPERILSTFSPVLRQWVSETIQNTPDEERLTPMVIVVPTIRSTTMNLIIKLLTVGKAVVPDAEAVSFEQSVSDLQVENVCAGDDEGFQDVKPAIQPRITQNSLIVSPPQLPQLVRQSGPGKSPTPAKSNNGSSYATQRAIGHNVRSSDSEDGSSDNVQKIYQSSSGRLIKRPRKEVPEDIPYRALSNSRSPSAAAGRPSTSQVKSSPMVNGNGNMPLQSINAINYSNMPVAVPNGSLGGEVVSGQFDCQVTGCNESFVSGPEAIKHYTTTHGIRIYKNNGSMKL